MTRILNGTRNSRAARNLTLKFCRRFRIPTISLSVRRYHEFAGFVKECPLAAVNVPCLDEPCDSQPLS
jgi:hypothetical protein